LHTTGPPISPLSFLPHPSPFNRQGASLRCCYLETPTKTQTLISSYQWHPLTQRPNGWFSTAVAPDFRPSTNASSAARSLTTSAMGCPRPPKKRPLDPLDGGADDTKSGIKTEWIQNDTEWTMISWFFHDTMDVMTDMMYTMGHRADGRDNQTLQRKPYRVCSTLKFGVWGFTW
jgi:hypothetical protein